ncbi:MAG: hypothetical protein ABI644_13915 [Arenimonas sp.]
MKDLRNLLIDCRIELRKYIKDFHKTEMCDKIDAAIADAGKPRTPENVPDPIIKDNKTLTTNQVGLAWQRAARDLKFSHPDLFEKLGQDVMRLLDAKTLVDPGTELEQLGVEVEKMKAAQEKLKKEQNAVAAERDALLGALATAVPALDDSGDRFATALARIEWLQTAMANKQVVGGKGGSSEAPSEGPVPSDEVLAAIIAGSRNFSKDQLDWALGEAMVLCGFQFTPHELIQQGQPHIAQIVQDARNK